MENKNTAVTRQAAQQPTAARKPKALEVMASRLNLDPAKLLETLQATCFKGANQEQMAALVVVANEYELNPFLKEIYAFPAKGGGIVPIVGVDGWIKIINRAAGFDGIEFEMEMSENGKPFACTATIHVKGRNHPVKATEYYSECYRETEPWIKMPCRMLRNKALIQTGRIAFGFAGIHDEDEAIDIASVVVDEPAQAKRVNAPQEQAPLEDPKAELAKLLEENAIPFSLFQTWGDETGNVPDATSYASISDVPSDVAKRLLRNRGGLVAGLIEAKGAAK